MRFTLVNMKIFVDTDDLLRNALGNAVKQGTTVTLVIIAAANEEVELLKHTECAVTGKTVCAHPREVT